MDPRPRDIEYYVDEVEVEVKEAGRHVGWENVRQVHRKVTRWEGGQPLIVSDVVVSNDPEQWKASNPNLPLRGDVQRTREQKLTDVQAFIKNATEEELRELGVDVPSGPTPEEVAEAEEAEDDDDPEVPEEPDSYPAHIGAGWYLLSTGEKVRGEAAAEAAQFALDNPDPVTDEE